MYVSVCERPRARRVCLSERETDVPFCSFAGDAETFPCGISGLQKCRQRKLLSPEAPLKEWTRERCSGFVVHITLSVFQTQTVFFSSCMTHYI